MWEIWFISNLDLILFKDMNRIIKWNTHCLQAIEFFFQNSKFLLQEANCQFAPDITIPIVMHIPWIFYRGIVIYKFLMILHANNYNIDLFWFWVYLFLILLLFGYHIDKYMLCLDIFPKKAWLQTLIAIVMSDTNWQLASCKKFWIWKKILMVLKERTIMVLLQHPPT